MKMLYKIILLCSMAVSALAAPAADEVPSEKQQLSVIPIVSQSEELEPNGTYKFSYETGNGIKREEIAYDKVLPKAEGRSAGSSEGGESSESDEIHVQQGSYSYTAPDGTLISLRYIADENGFQPVGDHLPKAPALTQTHFGSAEKSGRALKTLDSAPAASIPVVAAMSAEKSTPSSTPAEQSTASKSVDTTEAAPASTAKKEESTESPSAAVPKQKEAETKPAVASAQSESSEVAPASEDTPKSEPTKEVPAPSNSEIPAAVAAEDTSSTAAA